MKREYFTMLMNIFKIDGEHPAEYVCGVSGWELYITHLKNIMNTI